jgi:hypothetical protein
VRWDGVAGNAGGGAMISDTNRQTTIVSGTGFINYLYLGEYLSMPGKKAGTTPKDDTSDVISITSGHQVYTTRGTTFKTQRFSFPAATKAEYNVFRNWWVSDDRTNNLFVVQAEESMDDFPPIFCKIQEVEVSDREGGGEAYNFGFAITEAK